MCLFWCVFDVNIMKVSQFGNLERWSLSPWKLGQCISISMSPANDILQKNIMQNNDQQDSIYNMFYETIYKAVPSIIVNNIYFVDSFQEYCTYTNMNSFEICSAYRPALFFIWPCCKPKGEKGQQTTDIVQNGCYWLCKMATSTLTHFNLFNCQLILCIVHLCC